MSEDLTLPILSIIITIIFFIIPFVYSIVYQSYHNFNSKYERFSADNKDLYNQTRRIIFHYEVCEKFELLFDYLEDEKITNQLHLDEFYNDNERSRVKKIYERIRIQYTGITHSELNHDTSIPDDELKGLLEKMLEMNLLSFKTIKRQKFYFLCLSNYRTFDLLEKYEGDYQPHIIRIFQEIKSALDKYFDFKECYLNMKEYLQDYNRILKITTIKILFLLGILIGSSIVFLFYIEPFIHFLIIIILLSLLIGFLSYFFYDRNLKKIGGKITNSDHFFQTLIENCKESEL